MNIKLTSEHDKEVAKVISEGIKAFEDGLPISVNPYRNSYWIKNDESIESVWNVGYYQAQKKAETNNQGKILGHIDLSKFNKGKK